jgi:hypothetical protein
MGPSETVKLRCKLGSGKKSGQEKLAKTFGIEDVFDIVTVLEFFW